MERPRLVPPNAEWRVLLHSCCAPCSCSIMEMMAASGIDFTVFFYNPNIHARGEYEIRKNENKHFAKTQGIPFIDADYNRENWFDRVKGLEWEPERGRRCTVCFDMRFERTALYAYEHGFKVFTSSLGISRWKDMVQVNESGMRAASRYPGLIYWTYNWRKEGGSQRMYEIGRQEQFYQQEYCGCAYSLRDTNARRFQRGKAKIVIGTHYYGTPQTPSASHAPASPA